MAEHAVHHFVIEPFKGVGPIRFGMHKDEVSHVFTYVYSSFFKCDWSKVRSDYCEVVGLIIHYDDDARVNYIEVVKAEYATVTLELFGRDITGISFQELVGLLKKRGVNAHKMESGYDIRELGLTAVNNDFNSDEQPIECIEVAPPEESDR